MEKMTELFEQELAKLMKGCNPDQMPNTLVVEPEEQAEWDRWRK